MKIVTMAANLQTLRQQSHHFTNCRHKQKINDHSVKTTEIHRSPFHKLQTQHTIELQTQAGNSEYDMKTTDTQKKMSSFHEQQIQTGNQSSGHRTCWHRGQNHHSMNCRHREQNHHFRNCRHREQNHHLMNCRHRGQNHHLMNCRHRGQNHHLINCRHKQKRVITASNPQAH